LYTSFLWRDETFDILTENWKRLIGLNNLKSNPFLEDKMNRQEIKASENIFNGHKKENSFKYKFQDLDFTRSLDKLIKLKVKQRIDIVFKRLDHKIISEIFIHTGQLNDKLSLLFEGKLFEIELSSKKIIDESNKILIDYFINFINFFGQSPGILIRIEIETNIGNETTLTIGSKIYFHENSWFSKSIERKLRSISDKMNNDIFKNVQEEPPKEVKKVNTYIPSIGLALIGIIFISICFFKAFSNGNYLSLLKVTMDEEQMNFEKTIKIHENSIKRELIGSIKYIEEELSHIYQ
jgi:hypothetical protein